MINISTAYGVVLNDRTELTAHADMLQAPPYNALPQAPVIYIKPASCLTFGGAPVKMPKGETALKLAPTISLFFGRPSLEGGFAAVAAAALALDVSLPGGDYYRPDIARRCRDGFLPLGDFGPVELPDEIVTSIDDQIVHRWSLSRLNRSPATLIAALSGFMTLQAGDLLLVGLPGDAPIARAGQRVKVEAKPLASLSTLITEEAL